MWYAVGVAIRNMFYKTGAKKSVPTAIPSIGIGNLRMGGTGKTPHTEYLIRLFGYGSDGDTDTAIRKQECLRTIALLSRGYGRKTKGFRLADTTDNASTIGDEPAMIANKFRKLTVAVCEDRAEGIRQLSQLQQPPELVLLDDVYQHRNVKPSVMILLTEYGDPFCDDYILPFGNLREFRKGSCRADIVIVTKCPPMISETRRNEYRKRLKLLPQQHLFFSQIDYLQPQPLFNNTPWHTPKEILLVTGIAHPEPLLHHLELQCTVRQLRFPDHHKFTSLDCNIITQAFNNIHASDKVIVTTEKDAMRFNKKEIANQLSNMPVFFVPIAVKIHDEEKFKELILEKIKG